MSLGGDWPPADGIVVRLANLGVDVRWGSRLQKPAHGLRNSYDYKMARPAVPVFGPLAGYGTSVAVFRQRGHGGGEWQAEVTLTGRGLPDGAWPDQVRLQMAPLDREAPWTSPEQARDAMTALLHGDGEGLGWRSGGPPLPFASLERLTELLAEHDPG